MSTQQASEILQQLHEITDGLNKRVAAVDERMNKVGEDPVIKGLLERIEKFEQEYREALLSITAPSGLGSGPITNEEREKREAVEAFCRYGFSSAKLSETHRRNLTGSSDSDAGILLPTSISDDILFKATGFSDIATLCDTDTTSDTIVKFPKFSDVVVGWGNPGKLITKQDLESGFANLTIQNLYGLIVIHNDVLSDSSNNLFATFENRFARAVALARERAIMVGSGPDEYQGIATNSEVQARAIKTGVSGGLADIANDINGLTPFVRAYHGLSEEYQVNATIAANSQTIGEMRLLVDKQQRPLWQQTVAVGQPSTLQGMPVRRASGLPDHTVDGNLCAVVGDFSQYAIRDKAGQQLEVMRLEEKFSEYDSRGLQVKNRTGGMVKQSEAFTPIEVGV